MSCPEKFGEQIASGELYKEYQSLQHKVDMLVAEWEILCEQLEELKS